MARVFVTSDDLNVRIEVDDPAGEGEHYAFCLGCQTDILMGARERFHFENATEIARIHADACDRCGVHNCPVEGSHERGPACANSLLED